jgi:hypothetical protein
MRTFRNHINALAVAGIMAAALVLNASPASAETRISAKRADGSKVCIILATVISNASEHVQGVLGMVYEGLGCGY